MNFLQKEKKEQKNPVNNRFTGKRTKIQPQKAKADSKKMANSLKAPFACFPYLAHIFKSHVARKREGDEESTISCVPIVCVMLFLTCA